MKGNSMGYEYKDPPCEPDHVIITLTLVGTEGELGTPEDEFRVLCGEDQAKNLQETFMRFLNDHPEYCGYGWSLIFGVSND